MSGSEFKCAKSNEVGLWMERKPQVTVVKAKQVRIMTACEFTIRCALVSCPHPSCHASKPCSHRSSTECDFLSFPLILIEFRTTHSPDYLSEPNLPYIIEETRLPVERPPDEVLALIFEVAADFPLLLAAAPVPFAISSLSRRWQAVAIASPEIWTTIRISGRRSLNAAKLFLARSAPFKFRLSISTEARKHQLEVSRMLDVLLPHLHRCAALALCVSDEDLHQWSNVLSDQSKLQTLRALSITTYSYAPDEFWGPPESLFYFTALCSGLRSLRLSAGPTMNLHQHLHPLQLTTLDVRCAWDGALLRNICRNSQILETLVLREYLACVFDGADPTCLPSLTSLVLEYRDASLAEGLISLAHFLDLPNLTRLTIEGCGTPGVGHPWRAWDAQRHFPGLLVLSLRNIVFQRPIDSIVLARLSASITHLPLVDVYRGPLNDAEILANYANLRVIEIPRGTQICLPATLRLRVAVRAVLPPGRRLMDGELEFYLQSDGSSAEFERELPVHACSDFCELHNDLSPWRDMRSEAERIRDRIITAQRTNESERGLIVVR